MDPTTDNNSNNSNHLSNFPVLSYVITHLPSLSLTSPSQSQSASYDLENPDPNAPKAPPPPPEDPLLSKMPHLKDPTVIAQMKAAVSEIAQTRSILSALGDRPDHETVDVAKLKLVTIESELAVYLDEIALSPRSADTDEKKEGLEREKMMYKAIVQLDEMHEAYGGMLRGAEEKLMKIYENFEEGEEREWGEGGEEEDEVLKSGDGNVGDVVDLSGRKLRRILPEFFDKVKNVRVVNLSSNQLQAIPDSVAGLENLEEFILSSNSLQSLPDSIGLLLNLRILNISGNKLTALPDNICHCRSLVELDASFNNLGYLPTNIGLLVNLRKLSVQYNKIRSLPSSIGEIKSLQYLGVHFNELRGLPITIGKLTCLVTLNLCGNFSDLKELPETFGDLISLEELDLSNNQIHALPSTFGGLIKLVKLNLEQNPIIIPPAEVVNNGVENVKMFMRQRLADLIEEEEERSRQALLGDQETGWLKRSVSKLNGVVSSVSDYLGSPKTPTDPCLDQQL